jgi:acyl-coenzyme A synthetase/AMP-(fatty) acid ligase
MTVSFPFLVDARPDAIMAYRKARPISVTEFLSDVAALAARLPAHGHVINLCIDRYRFTVAFAAALTRGQISLLLPNETSDLIEAVVADYPDLYCLTDASFRHPAIVSVDYPENLESVSGLEVPCFAETQQAALVFTSGSTGRPVPNLKKWGSLVRSARAAGASFNVAAIPGAVLVATVPQQHMYGFESTVLLALQCGLALHGGRPFFPADIAASLDELPRPRILVTTPVHLRALVADSDAALPMVDFLLSAAAPLTPQLAAEAEARFKAPLYEIYGCSEAGQVSGRRTTQTDEWRCFDGISLRQDEQGTWASGSFIAADVLLQDVIELRGAECFLLHGRTKDMINIAGKRNSLMHLNHHLNSIPGVRDGVFIMPDDDGEAVTRLIAFAVAPGMTVDTIMSALRQRIDAAFLPRPLCLVDCLPRNATGKLPRAEMTKLVAEFTGK